MKALVVHERPDGGVFHPRDMAGTLRLGRDGGPWWRVRVRYDGDDYDLDTATREIAIVEASARKG